MISNPLLLLWLIEKLFGPIPRVILALILLPGAIAYEFGKFAWREYTELFDGLKFWED